MLPGGAFNGSACLTGAENNTSKVAIKTSSHVHINWLMNRVRVNSGVAHVDLAV